MRKSWMEMARGPRLLVILAVLLTGVFFVDRVAGLWQHPFRSAIKGWDNTFYYLWLRSPLVRGDFDFQRDLRETATMSSEDQSKALALVPTVTGHLPNKYPVGWALSSLPWYFLGATVTHLANLGGATLPLDGYGTCYQLALLLGQLCYALISLLLAGWLLRKFVPALEATYGLLFVWLGSFLFYYQTTNLSMTHNLNFLAQMGAYTCAFQIGEHPAKRRYWVGLGLFCSLAVLARYQSAVLLLYPFIQSLRVSFYQKSAKNLGLTVLTFLVGIAPQFEAWKIIYGHYFVYSYANERFDWSQAHWTEILFSPWHGLFYWHPLLFIAAVGFLSWAFSHRNWVTGCWVLSIFLTYLTNAGWGCWWFGSSFGLRAFDGCIFFGMLGFAHLLYQFRAFPSLRIILIGTTLLLIAWNIQLAWLARKDWLDLEDPVSHRQMIQTVHAFWTEKSATDWRRSGH